MHDVLYVTSEMYPFSKTGGLGDVMGALPPAIHAKGAKTAVITPFYGRMNLDGHKLRLVLFRSACGLSVAGYHG